MANTTITPLVLSTGAGLYANTGLTINTEFTTDRVAYETLTPMVTLLAVIDDAYDDGSLNIAANTVANLVSIGANVSGNFLPAVADSLPSNVTIDTGSTEFRGMTRELQFAAERYLGNGDYAIFCQAFATADAYVTVTNQMIFCAANANTYLGPTFNNMDDLITGDTVRVNLATPDFGSDLEALGDLIDFANLGYFGTPAGLLSQLSRRGNMLNGTLPAIRTALLAAGLTDLDISDLVNLNVVGLFNSNGLSPEAFDRLQKRAYPALCSIQGADLLDVLLILDITTTNITSMCDLLDPKKIFPNSYQSLTLATPAGDRLIYDSSGDVSSAIQPTLDGASLVVGGCENLAKILPPAQAAANRALQISFAQIKNISSAELPPLARAVADLATLRGLPLVANVATPISTATQTFYTTNLATGSGPGGSLLLTDVLGTPTNIGVGEYLRPVTSSLQELIDAGDLDDLTAIYQRMASLFAGTYGTPPTITIPAGAGAGSYATYDAALTALIVAADTEVGVVISAIGATADTLNQLWVDMSQHLAQEAVLQARAGIDFDTLTGLGQNEITSFLNNLAVYGVNTQVGMSAEYLQSIANVSVMSGQALVGAMRESRNNLRLDAANIGHDNLVPDTPPSLPQADLGDDTYTPAQARTLVQARLSPG